MLLEHVHMVRGTFKVLSSLVDKCIGAPESFRSHVDTESAPLQVTKEVDIWSIGCLFSEASVWAQYGWKRVVEYRRRRAAEIEAKGEGEGEHVFHFDGSLLAAVNNIHQDILDKTAVKDHITRSVLDRLVVDMMQHGSRPHAKQTFEKSKRLITNCKKQFGLGDADGKLIGSNKAEPRSPQKDPHDHHRSRAERDLPLEEPHPPDDEITPPPSPSRSQSSSHRHHHKSTSQRNNLNGTDALESPQAHEQDQHVVPNLPPFPNAAEHHESFPKQDVQQPTEEPVRPALSVDDGHAWKEKKKNGGIAVLPGEENLTSLDQRDHVSHTL